MLMPEDRAKSCALSLKEINRQLQPEQRRALRDIWRGIRKSKLPIRAFLDAYALFEQMLTDACRELFERGWINAADQDATRRIAQRYGALAWLDAMLQKEPIDRPRRKR